MAKKPTKKLILVVHGIGEQTAGETLDQLVGAEVGNKGALVESEVRWLRDEHADADERAVDLFPCHIRKVTSGTSDLVFSEVYWADLSRGKAGVVATAIELVKGILGLGHLVRENADSIYKEQNRRKCLARMVVCALHGPIAVLNLLLAAGALVSFGLILALAKQQECWNVCAAKELSEFWAGIAVLAVGLGAVWFGNKYRKKTGKATDSYLFRTFGRWLFRGGLALIVLVATTGFPEASLWSKSIRASISAVSWFETNFTGVDWYGFVLVFALMIVSLATLSGAAILPFCQAVSTKSDAMSDSKILYTVICAIMVVLWMVLGASFWSTLAKALPEAVIHPILLREGAKLMGLTWIMTGFIAVIAGLTWGERRAWARLRNRRNYKGAPAPRLLINNNIRVAFFYAVVVFGIAAFLLGYDAFFAEISIVKLFTYGLPLSFGISIVVGIIYMNFWKQISAGLGIGKDVITYLKGEPPGEGETKWVYPIRERILERFNTVLETMILSEEPKEVIIVSHSQGTVIAIDAIREKPNSCLFTAKGLTVRKLVTMGSPYTHLYTHYFPGRFKLPTKGDFRNKFSKWVNIFRIDDFVGTAIDTKNKSWPENEPVDPGGHTGYWTDDQVLDILNKEIIKT